MLDEIPAARAAARLTRQVEQAVAAVGLSVSQYRVLAILAEERAAAGGLAERLAVRPPSVTSVVDGLVARGLMQRGVDADDRRRQVLEVTPAGERVLAEADEAVAGRLRELADRLDARRADRAMSALCDWNVALDRARDARLAAGS
ncbi:MAG: MarR family transcriptional regulator [Actinomycetia bacterium]|nr:MarR family transcriptional regulator [Actinomycetes bacterium]